MLRLNAFPICLVLLQLAYLIQAQNNDTESTSSDWSYNNTDTWGINYPACNGNRQSPIALELRSSLITPMPPLKFVYYQMSLSQPLTLVNNGHTVEMDIPVTTNGNRSYIAGAMLTGKYEAAAFHFHWGSQGVKGSEHTINGRRFDVEMHIVHKNVRYATVEEAIQNRDGLAVLGVMFKIVENPDKIYPGLYRIFNQLPELINYRSEANISELTLAELLGDVNTKNFYTYSGSLTTPPCSQAVTWFVFPDPLPIAYEEIAKFWNLLDSHNQPLINNFRPLQPRNQRPVYYRV